MSYQLTQKGAVRGALIAMEEMVQRRSFDSLNEPERATLKEEAETIIAALGGSIRNEPEVKRLPDALGAVADLEKRQLNTLERDVVLGVAGSILLLFSSGN